MYLAQARACGSVQDCMSIYDKWAATYNDEVMDKAQEYVAPSIVAQVAFRASDNFARLTKKHGTIIITILEELWEAANFSAEIEKLVAEKLVMVVA